MRRLFVVIAAVVTVGVAVAAWGTAASAREAGPAGASSVEQKKPALPPLPANIKSRGRFNIAIKCDSPPFGYIDVRGRNAGFDVEIARWFSRFAFGKPNRVNMSVRHDSCSRARAHERPRRHGHRDLHLHRRPRDADRLLAGVLQGDGSPARGEQRPQLVRSRSWPGRRSRLRPDRSTTAGSRTASRTRRSWPRTASRTRCSSSGTAGRTRSCGTTPSCSVSPRRTGR